MIKPSCKREGKKITEKIENVIAVTRSCIDFISRQHVVEFAVQVY